MIGKNNLDPEEPGKMLHEKGVRSRRIV